MNEHNNDDAQALYKRCRCCLQALVILIVLLIAVGAAVFYLQ